MKARGLGRLYQRGNVWWVQYCHRGKVYRESSHSTVRADATRLLKRRLGEIGQGRLIGPVVERTTFEDLARMLAEDYRVNGRKSLPRVLQLVAHLREFFGLSQAVDITPDRITAYIRWRQEAKPHPRPATIRNEVAALGRMFTLAYRAGKVPVRPPIPTIEVRNTRTGFFEDHELREVLKHLPRYLRPFVEFAYDTGWRRGEIRLLTWRQVDFRTGMVRLEPGTTKNDEGRTFPFAVLPRLVELLRVQREETLALERERGVIIPWVFHRDGHQVTDYRDSWQTACRKAGVPGRLVHDLRRTAVRNLERACVPRSVAMKLTGHKTESVYRRYAIVSEADLTEGVGKLAALHAVASVGTRKVVAISEALSGRTDTVLAQFAAETAGLDPQPVAIGCESWRPQRDSNPCRRRERAVS